MFGNVGEQCRGPLEHWCNNVSLIGLKEVAEAGGLIKCVQSIISEGFGIKLDAEFEIERAH